MRVVERVTFPPSPEAQAPAAPDAPPSGLAQLARGDGDAALGAVAHHGQLGAAADVVGGQQAVHVVDAADGQVVDGDDQVLGAQAGGAGGDAG